MIDLQIFIWFIIIPVPIPLFFNSITAYPHFLANLKHDNDLEEQLTTNQALLNVTQKKKKNVIESI